MQRLLLVSLPQMNPLSIKILIRFVTLRGTLQLNFSKQIAFSLKDECRFFAIINRYKSHSLNCYVQFSL